MRKKNTAVLSNPVDRELAAVSMMTDRALGSSIADIQKKYQRSRSTVHRLLRDARQSAELVDHARDMVLERLVPLALAVYEKALLEGDVKVATSVLTGTGVLGRTALEDAAPEVVEDSIDLYRLQRTARMSDPSVS
jgi:hypothetical protein